MAEKAISLPFSIDPYGKVTVTEDQRKIWADRVRSVIGTTLRERVMRPSFGTAIPFSTFDSAETAEEEVTQEIERAFNEQLSLLSLQSIEITYDEYTNIFNINIIYDLPNNEKVETLIGVVLLQGNLPPYSQESV